MPLAEQVSATSKVLSPHGVTSLKTGDSVTCCINGVDCARGTIEHVGDRLEKRACGTLANIPAGKVLVRLTSVIRGNTRPMESFALTKEEKSGGLLTGWKYSTTTLNKIWTLWKDKKQAPLLVLPLGCVKISFGLADDMTPAAPSNNAAIDSPHNDKDYGEEMDQADGGDPLLDDHLDDANDALPASKDKGGLFHQFPQSKEEKC